jgi:proteasome lid subunit RPN8/RPN11
MFGNFFDNDDDTDQQNAQANQNSPSTSTDTTDDNEDEWDVSIEGHTGTGFTSSGLDSNSNSDSSSGSDMGESSGSRLFRTHTIQVNLGAEAEKPQPPNPNPRPEVETVPSPSPSPSPSPEFDSVSHSRGTFVFPPARDFMQKLEARGLNGAHQRVETVYVLAGPSYARPTDLFRLDNPAYYASATPRSVTTYGRQMAQKVARLYPDGQSPQLLARVHTHPNGSTRPSDTDKQSASEIASQFEAAFGTTDFEFFQGIHAYTDHSQNPGPSQRHDPTARSNTVSWQGEQYRHTLALFGPEFQNLRQVVIPDDE